jgi:hypothetical protein
MSSVDVKPTNRKSGGKPDAPNEPFKRALVSCARAMARHPDLDLNARFASGLRRFGAV